MLGPPPSLGDTMYLCLFKIKSILNSEVLLENQIKYLKLTITEKSTNNKIFDTFIFFFL